MTGTNLNKKLWMEITKLKLLNTSTSNPKFILEVSPFDTYDSQDEKHRNASSKSNECVITGIISPDSEIYREHSYLIEIKLLQTFPHSPPEVRFLTPIYHPNVANDGSFCNRILESEGMWKISLSLVDVIRSVVKTIDEPDMEYCFSFGIGREYMENKSEFDRKALEYVTKHGLPRQ